MDYVYDLAGKVQQVSDPTGTYGFAYDNMGRLIGTSTSYAFLPGHTFTNAYTYDAASNRTGFTAPDGSTESYVYDTLNRLSTLTDSAAGQFGFSYDALSRRTGLTRPNTVNSTYNYDSLSRLLSVLHQTGTTTLDGASYTYDAAGNRASKTNLLNSVTENYTYDPLYQLTQVVQGATTTESYSYDAVGNRLSSLGMSPYVYNSSNEMTSTPAATFTFDGNGNTLTKVDSNGTTTYGWDFENRLTSVALPGTGGTVTFKYDPFGRRIQKNSTGGDNNYVYDGPNVIEAVDGGGSVAVRYAQGVGVGEPVAVIRQGSLSYYEADGLGSITSLTDSSSTIASSYIYDSFGKLTASAGTVLDTFRYTGQELDTETGLYYYRARYYDPAVGRFLTEDPIEFDNSGSLYTYVENAPLDFVDPYGLQSAKPLPSGGNADNWTYGEIGQFGVNSMGDFSSPSGLADAKASIAAACQRQGNRCNAGRPAPRRPADIAAWNNIVNASGGTDLSGGGNFMCVNTQNCWFVHRCYACKNNRKTIIERATPLQPSGTVSVGHPPNQGTIYFYSDPLQGWDNAADRASACRPRPHPRPHRRRRK